MVGVMSTPMICPVGPTVCAAIRLSIPARTPMSTTRSPVLISPGLKGLPVPSKNSKGDSGMPSSHASSYPDIRITACRCGNETLYPGAELPLHICLDRSTVVLQIQGLFIVFVTPTTAIMPGTRTPKMERKIPLQPFLFCHVLWTTIQYMI